MINYTTHYTYMESEGFKLFTVVLLPDSKGKFPTAIYRTPYVAHYENEAEENITIEYMDRFKQWVKRGYAVVVQHCRGCGKSEGDFIPYLNDHEDGIALQEWIRKQGFYNGELFLFGGSYQCTVHYATAPFAADIKGAVFDVQDSERYNIYYRNGFFKKKLHGGWYVRMYKGKSHMKKSFTRGSFDILPLKDFTKAVFGEPAEDFDEMIKAPKPDHPFWNTRYGGNDIRNATDNAHFPILFTTGFYDIYTGGMFDMWKSMSESTRKMSAFVVSPYDHGDCCKLEEFDKTMKFPKGRRIEQFGELYEIDWFDYIRGKREAPFETGKVTYYNLFKNVWESSEHVSSPDTIELQMGEDEVTYVYNPFDAPRFKGGLSRAWGATGYQDPPNSRHDIISVYTKPFEEEVCVKGKMSAKLAVKSDCEDTCFYVRISIEKEEGDYGLRDDITSLCYALGDYTPNSLVELDFVFDEHAFMIKKGERLRIDIASAENEHYVRHTNQKGLYSEQTTAKIAHNTVDLKKSYLTLPVVR